MIETLCRIIVSFAFTLTPFQAFAFLYQSKFSDPFYVLFIILALVFFYFVALKIEPIALRKTYYISLAVHLFLASRFIAFQIFFFFGMIFSNDSFIRLISSGYKYSSKRNCKFLSDIWEDIVNGLPQILKRGVCIEWYPLVFHKPPQSFNSV